MKTSSLLHQTLSLKLPIVTMIKKFAFTSPSDPAVLYNQLNNTYPEKNTNPKNDANSKYYDIEQIQNLNFQDINKSLTLFQK